MYPRSIEQSSQVDVPLAIQLKSIHRSSPDWRLTDDQRVILAPGEVVLPFLAAWMKERRRLASSRIGGFCLGMFVAVTAEAGEREILEPMVAPFGSRMNVLHRKGGHRIALGTSAVLAAATSPFRYASSQVFTNARATHSTGGGSSPRSSISLGRDVPRNWASATRFESLST